MSNGVPQLKEKLAGDGVSFRDWNAIVKSLNMLLKLTGDGKNIRVNMRRATPNVEFVGNLRGGTATDSRFLAKLTATTVVTTGVRWLYDFVEVESTVTFSGDDATGVSFATLTGGRTGKAFNLLEWGNNGDPEPDSGDPWYLNDVDAHGDDYPAGFQLMPIGGGGTDQTHKIDRVVEITKRYDAANAKYWYTFSAQNQHDGTCE